MNQTGTVRLPIHVIKDINSCLRVARRLYQDQDREPTAAEIAAESGRSVDDVERLMSLHQRVTLHGGNGEDGSAPVDRLAARRETEPQRRAQRDNVNAIVDRWVCGLDDKQRAVVERRFGLHGHRRATLEKIGADFGVTRERVRQIQLDALKNLRQMMEAEGVSGDVILD